MLTPEEQGAIERTLAIKAAITPYVQTTSPPPVDMKLRITLLAALILVAERLNAIAERP